MRFALIIMLLFLAESAQAATLTVCHSGCDYSSIQAAIDAASQGDVIEVHSGTYHEEVAVTKDVKLKPVNTGGGGVGIDTIFLCGHPDAVSKGFTIGVVLPTCPGSSNIKVSDNTVTMGSNTITDTEINNRLSEAQQKINNIASSNFLQVPKAANANKIDTITEGRLTGSSQAAIRIVCPDGCEYSSIQAAIKAAKIGDTIEVHSGSYKYAVLNKNVTLRGVDTGGGKPHIDTLVLCGHSGTQSGSFADFSIKELDGTKYVGNGINVCDNPDALDESSKTSVLMSPGQQTATYWNDKGIQLYDRGKYDEAIVAYDRAIVLNPQLAAVWNNKGYVLTDQGKYDDATLNFDRAIALDPQLAPAWVGQGATLYHQGKYKEAIQACDKAIQLDPNNAIAWSNKGFSLYELGKYNDAITCFNEAISLKPDKVAWKGKGDCLFQLADYNQALYCYNEAIKLNPDFALAWHNKGSALKMLGRNVESEAAFVKAKELGYKG